MKLISLFFVASMLIIIVGCNPDENFWERCLNKNTIGSYENYIRKFPDGIHSKDAYKKIEKLEWEIALKDTINKEKLSILISKYPNNPNVKIASEIIWKANKKQFQKELNAKIKKFNYKNIKKYLGEIIYINENSCAFKIWGPAKLNLMIIGENKSLKIYCEPNPCVYIPEELKEGTVVNIYYANDYYSDYFTPIGISAISSGLNINNFGSSKN